MFGSFCFPRGNFPQQFSLCNQFNLLCPARKALFCLTAAALAKLASLSLRLSFTLERDSSLKGFRGTAWGTQISILFAALCPLGALPPNDRVGIFIKKQKGKTIMKPIPSPSLYRIKPKFRLNASTVSHLHLRLGRSHLATQAFCQLTGEEKSKRTCEWMHKYWGIV